VEVILRVIKASRSGKEEAGAFRGWGKNKVTVRTVSRIGALLRPRWRKPGTKVLPCGPPRVT
jgi:hypothetical protein